MTAYSAHLKQDPAASIVQPRATLVPTITRRAAIEMPLAAPKIAVGQNAGDVPRDESAAPGEFDLNLDLDVPAFLRRNEG